MTNVLLLLLLLLSSSGLVPVLASKDESCGGTYRGFQYTISSPNYPHDYPEVRQKCVYHLQADASSECEQQFHLQFQDFNVRPSENCKDDYLKVGERNVFCGSVSGLRRFTPRKNNTLSVVFRSSGRRTGAKGRFKILVTALPCSSELNPLKDHANDVRPIGDVQSQRESAHTTTYLFVPANEARKGALESLASEIHPPSLRPAISFKSAAELPSVRSAAWDTSSSDLANHKMTTWSPSFGEPSLGLVNYDLQVAGRDCDIYNRGGVLAPQTNGALDHYKPQLSQEELGSRLGATSNFIYDPRQGLLNANGNYQGSIYQQQLGYVGSSYPTSNNYQYPLVGPSLGAGYQTRPFDAALYGGPNGWNYHSAGWNAGECCRLRQSAGRRFFIASPAFPSAAGPSIGTYSCRYTIIKASPDVCRLRLNLRFFNFGEENDFCNYGYVQIDGRRYCGCRSGQTLRIPFADYQKSIFVSYAGHPRSKFSGFLVDVVQESCGASGGPPNPGYPANPYSYQPGNSQTYYSAYPRRRGGSATRSYNSSSVAGSRARRHSGYAYPRPGAPPAFVERDVDANVDRLFAGGCESRLFVDWLLASKELALRGARCEPSGGTYRSARAMHAADTDRSLDLCQPLDGVQGALKSPLYPSNYPARLEKCYRFNRAPNFCQLQLQFENFDLETSEGCAKDYFSFGEHDKKYCGTSLNNCKAIFDLTRNNFMEIRFVSDAQGSGNGFNIVFSQQPCQLPTKP